MDLTLAERGKEKGQRVTHGRAGIRLAGLSGQKPQHPRSWYVCQIKLYKEMGLLLTAESRKKGSYYRDESRR